MALTERGELGNTIEGAASCMSVNTAALHGPAPTPPDTAATNTNADTTKEPVMNLTELTIEVRAKVGDNDYNTLGTASTPIRSPQDPTTLDLRDLIKDALEALLRSLGGAPVSSARIVAPITGATDDQAGTKPQPGHE